MAIEIIVKNSKGDVVARYDLDQLEEAKQHDRVMEAADELFPHVSELPSVKDLKLSETQIEGICIDLLRNQAELIPLLEKGKPAARRGRRAAGERQSSDGNNAEEENSDGHNSDGHNSDGNKAPGNESEHPTSDAAA